MSDWERKGCKWEAGRREDRKENKDEGRWQDDPEDIKAKKIAREETAHVAWPKIVAFSTVMFGTPIGAQPGSLTHAYSVLVSRRWCL